MPDYQTTAPTTLALTLADAKLQLNVSSTIDDAIITSHIKAATLMLENRTNRCFVTQTRKLLLQNFGDPQHVRDRYVVIPRSPVKSISSITYVASEGTTTTLPSTDYTASIYDQPSRIGEAYNATWPSVRYQPNAVAVTYVAGHSTVSSGVPENIKQAVRMVVSHWYRNREAVVTGTISKEVEYGVDALLESEHVERYA